MRVTDTPEQDEREDSLEEYDHFDFRVSPQMDKAAFKEAVRQACPPDVRGSVDAAFRMLGGIVPESAIFYRHHVADYVQFVGSLYRLNAQLEEGRTAKRDIDGIKKRARHYGINLDVLTKGAA